MEAAHSAGLTREQSSNDSERALIHGNQTNNLLEETSIDIREITMNPPLPRPPKEKQKF